MELLNEIPDAIDCKGVVSGVHPNRARLQFDARSSSGHRTQWLTLSIASLLSVAASSASAHTFLLSRGTSVVEPNRVVTTLQINAEDFLHYGYFRTVKGITAQQLREAVAAHGKHLIEHFIIRDADGVRRPNTLVKTAFDEPANPTLDYRALRDVFVEYTLESPLESPPRYLTFQQTFGAGGPSVRAQLILRVQTATTETGRFITLTSGGNVETLAFPRRPHARPAGDDPAPADDAPNLDDLKSVRAVVNIDDDEIRLEIFIPVTLLETWMPISRADRDFLEPAEMNVARARLLPLFTGRNQFTIDGEPVTPEAVRLEFLAPEAPGLQTDKPSHRLSVWTTRVAAELRYKVEAPPRRVDLDWRLFNGAVLNAQATVEFKQERQDHLLTTYQPALNWQRPRQ